MWTVTTLFRYKKEFTMKYKRYVDFSVMYDKHTCKVGEPGLPVVADEQGKEVILSKNQLLQVADHHFTKFSVSPSVTMEINIPDDIEGSFYEGQIHVGVKEICFQPSLPNCHVTELSKILENESNRNILCLMEDLTSGLHFSVKMTLLSLFLHQNKEVLIAVKIM